MLKTKQFLLVVYVLLILLFQFFTSFDKFNVPFLDSRIHYNRDNALFTKYAYDGNYNGDLKSQFGVTGNSYLSESQKVGESGYYTHHPFFFKMLFQQYTKVVGYGENASRTFYFIENGIILVLLFFCVYLLTQNAHLAFLSSAFLLSIPLFMIFQTAVKFETDGVFGMLLSFLSILLIDKKGLTKSTGIFFFISTVILMWSHWPSYVFYFLFWCYYLFLLFKKGGSDMKKIFFIFTFSGIVGILVFLFMVIFLKGGWNQFYTDIFGAFLFRSNQESNSIIPFGIYLDRQWVYIGINYSYVLFYLFLGVIGYFIFTIKNQIKIVSSQGNFLFVFGIFALLLPAIFWQFLFTNGSFIHNYWQYYFNVPVVLIFSYAFYQFQQKYNFGNWIYFLGAFFVFILSIVSYKDYNATVYNQGGTVDDIELLKQTKKETFSKIIFIPTVDVPQNSWFQGEIFPYYSLRPVINYTPGYVFLGDEKVILLHHNEQKQVLSEVGKVLHLDFANEKCTQMFCIYDLKK